MTDDLQPIKIEPLLPEVRANMLSNETSIFFNVALFEQCQRLAQMFAASTMVPKHFRGSIGNCMIGLNYAYRLQADPFMVMQSLYEVHGRPGIEGKLVEAVINQSGKYSEPLQYAWLDPMDKEVSRRDVLRADIPSEYGCQAYTIDKKSGKRVDGPKITWAIVKAEGWYDKNGPDGTVDSNKWRTMPEMMFYYRSASWFGNKNCPELKLGMHTVEEIEDIVELRQKANGSFGMPGPASDLNEKLKADKGEQPKIDPYATKEAEKPKPKEEEDPIRKEYIKLKTAGFKPWVMINKERIPTMPTTNQLEIREKWFSPQFYPNDPYPLDTKEVTQRDELTEEPPWDESNPPPIGEEKSSDPPFFLHCMLSYDERPEKREDGTINSEVCENMCEAPLKNHCKSWKSFQESGGKEE